MLKLNLFLPNTRRSKRMNKSERNKVFIDRDKLYSLIEGKIPTKSQTDTILNKALKLKGLNLEDVASLLRVDDISVIHKIMETAHTVKEEIYGKRLVIFAPIYLSLIHISEPTRLGMISY